MANDGNGIWHAKPDLDRLNEMGRDSMVHHLGIRFTEIGPDFLCATMDVDEKSRQPMGLLHGGASCALAETIASTGAGLLLDDGSHYPVGMEINANHVRAVRDGVVSATARPLHVGGRSQVWEIEIRAAGGDLVCISRMTIAILERRAQSA